MCSWRRATIRRPLRSKRARTSPVSPRSNASGLTRTRVRDPSATIAEGYRCRLGRRRSGCGGRSRSVLPGGLPGESRAGGGPPRPCLARLGTARGAGARGRSRRRATRAGLRAGGAARFRRPARFPGGAARLTCGPPLGRLAVGTDRPPGIDRPFARLARILDPRAAARAAQVRALDREAAARARLLLELPEAKLGRPDLELSLVGVLEELRGPQNRVHDRPHVGKERRA